MVMITVMKRKKKETDSVGHLTRSRIEGTGIESNEGINEKICEYC